MTEIDVHMNCQHRLGLAEQSMFHGNLTIKANIIAKTAIVLLDSDRSRKPRNIERVQYGILAMIILKSMPLVVFVERGTCPAVRRNALFVSPAINQMYSQWYV